MPVCSGGDVAPPGHGTVVPPGQGEGGDLWCALLEDACREPPSVGGPNHTQSLQAICNYLPMVLVVYN